MGKGNTDLPNDSRVEALLQLVQICAIGGSVCFMKQKITIKDIIWLQAIVMIYTFSGVTAKIASDKEPLQFMLLYGVEIAILGVYAILWQQLIKKFDLSIAYANKAIGIVWSMIWAVVFFNNEITWKNILGVILVVLGTIILNTDMQDKEEEACAK